MTVDRVVRVACPSRGTLLASKRLDAYVSVLKWSLNSRRCRSRRRIVDFLAGSRKRAPTRSTSPGLAAQTPDSALIRWMHYARGAIAGRSARRRGRHEGRFGHLVAQDASVRRVLLDRQRPRRADAVDVWRRRRASAPRRSSSIRGGKVSHFNYFTNRPPPTRSRTRSSNRRCRQLSHHRPAVLGRQGFVDGLRAARPPANERRKARRCSCCPAFSAAI